MLPHSPTIDQRLAARRPTPGIRPVMRQRWEDLLFLHWEIAAPELQERLPPGLHVDTFDGVAFIGVVPFFMRQVRPTGLFPLPWLSDFLELNVRTYVQDEAGIPGVWFFSLDANQPVAVEVARRWYHLPYQHAEMKASRAPEGIDYHCRRRSQAGIASYRYAPVTSGKEAEPGTLEFFLLERYLLYAWNPKRRVLYRGQVEHTPYRFQPAEPAEAAGLPLHWEGFENLGPALPSMVATSVDVRAYAVEEVSPG